jgi:hypothetical protein
MVYVWGVLCFGSFLAMYVWRDSAMFPYLALGGAAFAALAFLTIVFGRKL